jgi:hypothetical protein
MARSSVAVGMKTGTRGAGVPAAKMIRHVHPGKNVQIPDFRGNPGSAGVPARRPEPAYVSHPPRAAERRGGGTHGSLHVTDTGIAMTDKGVMYRGGDKVFIIGPGRRVSLLAEGRNLGRPNGITWDPDGRRWIIVSFDPFRSEVYAVRPGQNVARGEEGRTVLARGLGKFDGVERLADGRLLVTCWTDSRLHLIGGGRDERIIRNLWQPADLGVDTRRQRVAIPLVLQGRVEIWELPPR